MRWTLVLLVVALGLGVWLHSPSETRVAPSVLGEIPFFEPAPESASLQLVSGERSVAERVPIDGFGVYDESHPTVVAPSSRMSNVAAPLSCAVKVVVRSPRGERLSGIQVSITSLNKPPTIDELRTNTASDGTFVVDVPPGNYEIVARDDALRAEARALRTVKTDRTVNLALVEDEERIAVSGVVIDERGDAIVGIAMTLSCSGAEEGLFDRSLRQGASVCTGERGEFELRLRRSPACAQMDVVVGVDPFLAEFTPARVRVPFGTQSLVIRRSPVWSAESVRMRVVNAATKESIARSTLTLNHVGSGNRRIVEGRDGTIDAQLARRDDVLWKVESRGYFPTTGTAADLLARVHGGAIEVELVRDPSKSTIERAWTGHLRR
ncbi:MAG: hypothetical protein ACKVWV_12020 [Planctomycetota bacterium]